MTIIQTLVMAVLQGVSELFPISSLGHAVIVPSLLHWNLDQRSATFLPFLAVMHLGTAAALLLYFSRDWIAILSGITGRNGAEVAAQSRHILLLIVVATIPAVIVGAVAEKPLRALFATPEIAACFLVLNGVLLLVADRLRLRRADRADRPVASLRLGDALAVGLWQLLAFLPGISRSGATMTGALLRGAGHEMAARFSFLIATPIIVAATAHQLLSLRHSAGGLSGAAPMLLLAAVVAGVVAFGSTAFLMRYFREHENWALRPFALYCIAAGIVFFALVHV
ncbi:MAG: undecaprenyl-diphosphate phosphatase [Gluconacetobacter diazotrophicus]|nr:undecaprenyl-diphosphate phosphatase [Gluconacetobacter diazotrophicus]